MKAFLHTPIKIILDSEEVEITITDLIRLNEAKPGGDLILKEQAEKAFKPFASCYLFKKAGVESGNAAFRNELAVLILPVNPHTNVEVGLAVNSKCLENIK